MQVAHIDDLNYLRFAGRLAKLDRIDQSPDLDSDSRDRYVQYQGENGNTVQAKIHYDSPRSFGYSSRELDATGQPILYTSEQFVQFDGVQAQLTQNELRRNPEGKWDTGLAVIRLYATGLRTPEEQVAGHEEDFANWHFAAK